MILRLRQNLELSWNIFEELKLEYFCPNRKQKRNLDWEKFCPKRQKGKNIQRVGLEIKKRERESKVKQVRRGVMNPVRWAGKRIMIKSVSQIDSKITACCHFMQPIEKSLYQSWLATGANRKKAHVRIFCKNSLCNSNSLVIPSAFLLLSFLFRPPEKVSFN